MPSFSVRRFNTSTRTAHTSLTCRPFEIASTPLPPRSVSPIPTIRQERLSTPGARRFRRQPAVDVVTIIDEAYLEYISHPAYPSAVDMVRNNKNVVVVKTMSKVHGLAGARIGYAIGKSSLVTAMRNRQFIAAISAPSLAAGVVALNDTRAYSTYSSIGRPKPKTTATPFSGDGVAVYRIRGQLLHGRCRPERRSGPVALADEGIYVRTGWGMPNSTCASRPASKTR